MSGCLTWSQLQSSPPSSWLERQGLGLRGPLISLSETIARGFDVLSVGETEVVRLALYSSNQKGAMSSDSVSSEALALLLVALKLWLVFSIFLLSVFLPSLPPLHFSLSLRLPFSPTHSLRRKLTYAFPRPDIKTAFRPALDPSMLGDCLTHIKQIKYFFFSCEKL